MCLKYWKVWVVNKLWPKNIFFNTKNIFGTPKKGGRRIFFKFFFLKSVHFYVNTIYSFLFHTIFLPKTHFLSIWKKTKKKNCLYFYILALCEYIYCEFGLDMSMQAGDKNSEASEVPKSEVPVSGGRYR